jgi:LytR cell envelope-related transcriptional attenuator
MTVRNRPYQRRRRGPVLVVMAVLAVATAVTWTTVLITTGAAAGVTACPVPTAGPPPGQVLPPSALAGVPPVPPSAVKVRVLNAGGQRGQANLVAAQLGDFGFAQAAPPTNDKLFPDGDMACTGQIRFGQAGQGAASTVSLVVPCAELVRDGRPDDTVDVAVGTTFGNVNPSRAVRDALDQLGVSGSGSTGSGNADPAAGNTPPPATPIVDSATLASARAATCN